MYVNIMHNLFLPRSELTVCRNCENKHGTKTFGFTSMHTRYCQCMHELCAQGSSVRVLLSVRCIECSRCLRRCTFIVCVMSERKSMLSSCWIERELSANLVVLTQIPLWMLMNKSSGLNRTMSQEYHHGLVWIANTDGNVCIASDGTKFDREYLHTKNKNLCQLARFILPLCCSQIRLILCSCGTKRQHLPSVSPRSLVCC